MKAILIDSFTQEIKEVNYSGNYQQINQFLGCSCFTVGAYLENGDCIFVDDEGLLSEPTHFFKVPQYPNPLAGRGFVLGSSKRSGESRDCKSTLEEIKKLVTFEDINTVALKAQMGIYR